ncbi:hypothetical protein RB597_009846 [Gaeumannomyces tritici]
MYQAGFFPVLPWLEMRGCPLRHNFPKAAHVIRHSPTCVTCVEWIGGPQLLTPNPRGFNFAAHTNFCLVPQTNNIDNRFAKMPTRFSKTRKHRGHVSAGKGRVGKHRKHPGGRGLAGGQHHHRTNLDKYHPGYFGKLWSLIPAEKQAEYAKAGASSDKIPQIDLLSFGYSKLLGKGRLPEVPLVVRARWVSKEAEKKIKDAGGAIELVA